MEAAHRAGLVPSARLASLARVGFVAALVVAAAPWWAARELPVAFWILAALAVVADLRPDPAPGRRAGAVVLPSVCLAFAVVLAWGLLPALAVQAVAVTVAAGRMPQPGRRSLHLIAQYGAGLVGASGVVGFDGLGGAADRTVSPGTDAALVVVGAVAWTVARYAVVAVTAHVVSAEPVTPTVRRAPHELSLTGATLLLGALLVPVAHAAPTLVPLVLAPLLAVNRLGRVLNDQRRAGRVDQLTGLVNRRSLAAEVTRLARKAAAGEATHGALLLLDLHRFRDVNDAMGHGAGDELLRGVADRLVRALPAHDLVARLEGDQFAVLAPRIRDAEAARRLARHLGAVLAEPLAVGGLPVEVGAAVGVALWPEHGPDFTRLLRHAEVARYEAKRRGDGTALYAPGTGRCPDRLALLTDLRATLRASPADGGAADGDTGEITIYYQPQVAVASGEVVGVEALLRWRRPGSGVVDPAELVRVAEQSPLMPLLTARVLHDVIEQLGRWRPAGQAVRTSVNVSARDLAATDVVDRIEDLLRRYAVPAALLQLEITESSLMADARRVLATVDRLTRLGVSVSLDDFGTGYSSLHHVRRLPVSEIKIDRSFVLGMVASPPDAAIVRSLIHLAEALGLRVVAEGVEDERTWRALHAAGCHLAQGWFYARPMPADEFTEWLSRYRPVRPQGGVAPPERVTSAPGPA